MSGTKLILLHDSKIEEQILPHSQLSIYAENEAAEATRTSPKEKSNQLQKKVLDSAFQAR
jgi:hypothetical protein